ncbi:MAG: hypothetical protein V9E96_15830 [Chitinophagaceae bacterium]
MTISTTNKPNWVIALGIPILIFLSCFFITLTSKFKTNSALLSSAILIDILVVAPFIYFLAIRKSNISKLTVSRIFILGLLVAGFILNAHSNTLLQIIKTWISPLIEGVVIFFIGSKFYHANKKAKESNTNKLDFLIHCRYVMFQVTGNEKFATIVASEIAVLYYAFLGSKDKTIDYETKFTSYKENGVGIVLWAILSIFLIEATGMHFLLSIWNKTIAWIITGLSFYTCIQLFAHIKAVKARPIIINKDSLEIHNGLAGDAYILFNNIEKFELSKKIPPNRTPIKVALLKGLENHNIVVYLKTPIQVTKIFGIKETTDTVLFYVEKSNEFSNALSLRLTAS